MEFHISSIEQISEVARQFVSAMGKHKLFAFYGEMGAGKTTFIKVLCNELGVVDVVNSPTFAIVNDYETTLSEHIYHFDFYRLKTPQEALDFGVEDYFYSGHICFMEWPDQIGSLLPSESVRVFITVNADGSRTIVAEF
ncbi:MAG TPA: tRNA (adenosine(37)-N6)-threonylcarbamoyltransferase complex ATPase subunit type 1 TsaE [Paludibacteraceae bacterium]|jgi:tRNA threonylcarbamoyladenosine biosynthesis protein TsaE|nr:tRNA (adenosine(37)-N6)-threonylcarbamoyltransferase complex ATPase subunit type 1 TsaE [Paludibacteraceae bacterium]HQB69125.1 tRNA (adenosine(37)-N6)-threonylcarbamoyltransferase complex ATPase subunit type 1 TsaE [Paludibacteraceae bacterium]HRS67562.1 tRNA (adenosine(37)-N6)-threonylcarbamoyltransferase complex ATPase subunit type 1 TsaE [Paludibacteraceae bacterium]